VTLKRRAAELGTTVSRLIEDSVRLAAARPRAAEPEQFKLVTYGQGGRFTALGVDRTSALLEPETWSATADRKGEGWTSRTSTS
jgi:hypothetical protein